MRKILLIAFIVLAAIGTYSAYSYYQKIYGVQINSENDKVLFIKSDWSYDDFLNTLTDSLWINSIEDVKWVAQKKNLPNKLKPGKYLIKSGWNTEEFVNAIRSGEQQPIELTFNNIRTIHQLAGRVSKVLEADSVSFLGYLQAPKVHQKYGFSKATFPALFVPNTYQFYWNTSPEKFVARMAKEFKSFWTVERKNKATKLGLTQSEVVILASIVEEETKMNDEKPRVAGVYLNRLRKGMLLQADPTLIFGIGDFSIHRVLNIHKKVDSPYNTYMYKGLPPGPIRIPEISSIDAVLNPISHNFLYFCAKEDFSGYHNFATTYRDHLNNARRYQQALNKRKIYN